jgi:hypothetical protein
LLDRLIEARKRWHDAGPERLRRRWPVMLSGGGLLVFLACLERIFGG